MILRKNLFQKKIRNKCASDGFLMGIQLFYKNAIYI
jgi:hypothetical protein